MAPPTFLTEKVERESVGPVGGHRFYASPSLAANAEDANSVRVTIDASAVELVALQRAIATTAKSTPRPGRKADTIATDPDVVRKAIETAIAAVFSRSFAGEINKVVDAYRLMLRESLAKGEDPELLAALNKARLQEKILAATSMVDQTQACELLGLSNANPSATMKRKEDKQELLRFTVDGRAAYPFFQFDVEGRRIFPAMARLIASKPKSWSDFRLLHWLTRPHLDMDGTPAEALRMEEDAVIAAFGREIEPAMHG